MSWINILLSVSISAALLGCSDKGETESSDSQAALSKSDVYKLMHGEFMDSCRLRPEYARKKKAGTLDTHCACIFKTAMSGLSEDEQLVTAFYLYGEQHEAFRARLSEIKPNYDAMPAAVKAVGRAAKKCR